MTPKTAEILKPFGDYYTEGPNKRVIAILQEALDEAKKGEIVGIAVAKILPNGEIGSDADCGNRCFAELCGSVAVLQHDLIEKWKSHD